MRIRVEGIDDVQRLSAQRPPGYFHPMAEERFNQILETIRRRRDESDSTRVISAKYRARLVGDNLQDGDAELEVEHTGEQPWLAPLGSMSFAIGDPVWNDDPPRPAEIGVDAAGRTVLAVANSGTLKFPWTQRGRRRGGELHFALQLPAAGQNELVLELPVELTPSLAPGVISSMEPVVTAPTESAEAESPEAPAKPDGSFGWRRWRMSLGAGGVHQLTLRASQPNDRQRTLEYIQESTYRLGVGGVELQTELRFPNGLPPEVLLNVGSELQLDARVGDRPVPLEQVGSNQVLLRMPTERPESRVRLFGFAELPLDVLWTLPRVAVENGQWRAGESKIIVSHLLRVRHLQLDGLTQTGHRRQPNGGEEIRLRQDQPRAAARIDLRNRSHALSALAGITVRWNDDQLLATTVAEVSVDWGEIFAAELEIPAGWQIDSVETIPADALDANLLSLTPANGVLKVPLLKPISPESSVKIQLQSHLQQSRRNKSVAGRRLFVGRPLGMDTTCYLSVQGELSNDHDLARVDPSQAPVSRVVKPVTGGVVIRDSAEASQFTVSEPPQRPDYAVEIRVDAIPGEETLREQYRIRCLPESGAVSNVRIRMSASSEPLRWSVVRDRDIGTSPSPVAPAAASAPAPPRSDSDGADQRDASVPVEVVAVALEDNDTPLDAEGRRLDLELSQPISGPFELVAVRKRPFKAATLLSLVSVPEAVSQTGAVYIHNTAPLSIAAGDLEQLPIPTGDAGQSPALQAAYRYEPATLGIISVAPVVTAVGELPWGSLQVWSHHIDSQCERDGKLRHEAAFHMESHGAQTVTLFIPPEAHVLRVTLDDTSLPLNIVRQIESPASAEKSSFRRQMEIRLPPRDRFVTLRVAYWSQSSPFGWQATPKAPLLHLTTPAMETHWTLSVPPGYDDASRWTGWQALARPLGWAHQDEVEIVARADHVVRRLLTAPWSNWGQLLREYQRKVDGGWAPPLYVDVAGIQSAGVLPSTELADNGDLSDAGLTLHRARDVDGVVLTSATHVPDGAAEHVTAGAWASDMNESPIWHDHEPPPAINQNWRQFSRAIDPAGDSTSVSLTVHRIDSLRGAAAATLLIFAGLAFGRRPVVLLQMMLAGWLTAGMAPTPFNWLGAAAGWGAMLGGLIGSAWPRIWKTASRGQGRPALSIALPVAIGIIAAGALLGAEDDPPPPDILYRVLVPEKVEATRIGKPIYVPTPLWNALLSAEQSAMSGPEGWAITKADYTLTPSRDDESDNPQLTANYVLRVFGDHQTVQLPMAADDGEVLTTALDSMPVVADWSADKQALVITTDLPGEYRLTIVRRLNSREDSGRRSLLVAVPATPNARLEIAGRPANTMAAVNTPLTESAEVESRGRQERQPGRLLAELGDVQELDIRWEEQGRSASRQVEEHLWLQIKRVDSVVLESMFRYQSDQSLGQLRVWAEPRLRLLSMSLNGEPVTPKVSSQPDGSVFTIAAPDDTRNAELRAAFHATDVSGVGRIKPPKLSAFAETASRKWFAFSILDPELQGRLEGDAERIDAAQFSVSWPEASGVAETVRTDTGDFDVVVAYRKPEPIVSQHTKMILGRQQTAVQYEAEFDRLSSRTFQHVLQVPANLKVESLKVVEEGAEVAQRFDVDEAGNLTIFLDRAAEAPQQTVLLTGQVPTRSDVRTLPRIVAASAAVAEHDIEILRRNDLEVVKFDQPRNLEVDRNGAGEYREGGRLVARLRPSGARYSARIHTRPNTPRGNVSLVTILARKNDEWSAELRGVVHMTPDSGSIDLLRIRVPQSLTRLRSEPSDMAIIETAQEDGAEWRLIPASPLAPNTDREGADPQPFHFSIHASLSSTDGIVRAPNLSLQGLPSQRFLALPRLADSQQIDWMTPRGLLATELPAALTPVNDALDVFEVVDRRFEATVRRVERTKRTAVVALADIQVSSDAGNCHGVAIFDIEPAGLSTLDIAVPQNCQLTGITVNDVAVVHTPDEAPSGKEVRVPLGPNYLPQRVVVSFRGKVSAADGKRSIPVPSVAGLDTAWTVGSVADDEVKLLPSDVPSQHQRHELPLDSGLVEHDLLRLRTISELLSSAADIALDRPLEEVSDWYEPWAQRAENIYRRLRRQPLLDRQRESLDEFLAAERATAERLKLTRILRKVRDESQGFVTRSVARQAALRTASRHFNVVARGARGELEAPLQPAPRTIPLWGWLASVGLAVLAVGRLPVDHWYEQWPFLFIALAGLALAIWLPWPWIGWSIIALTMFTSMQP
ncbi:MAG: hypothetical protein KDB14_24850 [Planctomycetales bacterium]|nr:hypothetical protein [Planctomycetales bacterium]